jgi:Mitochondrial ribosomal protein S25
LKQHFDTLDLSPIVGPGPFNTLLEGEEALEKANEERRIMIAPLDGKRRALGSKRRELMTAKEDILKAKIQQEINDLRQTHEEIATALEPSLKELREKIKSIRERVEQMRSLPRTGLTYDQARKEFYQLRLEQDVERQVEKEEALHYGAYFDGSEIERSLEKEDEAWEDWKTWAYGEIENDRHKAAGANAVGVPSLEDAEDMEDTVSNPEAQLNLAMEDMRVAEGAGAENSRPA